MKVTRRGFLGTAAGAAAGAGTSRALLEGTSRLVALTSEPLYPPRGPEQLRSSFCGECPAGCGTRVRLVGERAVYVGGNPDHPLNRGGLCPRGLASLQAHYHPDRLTGPLGRTAGGGAEGYEPIDWDDALGRVVERLQALRAGRRPQRLAMLRAATDNTLGRMIARFLEAFGSPNDLRLHPVPAAQRAAWQLTQGYAEGVGFDLERAAQVLSFGAGLLDGWGSPAFQLRAYGQLRRGRQERRGRLVQVEPRLSVTGSKADEWVAVRPGTEGIFALGLAHVLIMERLYDHRFVEEHTFGFDRWRDERGREQAGFKEWVLENFPLSRVTEATEVPPETVLSLARALPLRAPAVAIAGRAAALQENGLWTCWAVHTLNALLGSVDVEGGVQVPLPVPYAELPPLKPDEVAAAGLRLHPFGRPAGSPIAEVELSPLAALLAAAEGPKPPLDLLLIVECDPLALSPAPERLRQALERIPLVVLLTAQPNETMACADLVLPTGSALERWDDVATPPMVPFTLCGLRQPVLPAKGNSRHPGDVLLELSRRLGEPVASALPWSDYVTALRAGIEGLFTAQRGDAFGSAVEEMWARLMQRTGWWAPSYRSFEELWSQMRERGGWWDPTYDPGEWRRVLRTPSARFDLAPRLVAPAPAAAAGGGEYPLLLYPFEVLALGHGEFVDLPFLQTLVGPHFDGPVEGWVELHPAVAGELGLADGERVRVESEAGRVEVRLRVYEGVHPSLAAMPLGMGRTVGRWARGWGANPLALMGPHVDPATGELTEYQTHVRVSRA